MSLSKMSRPSQTWLSSLDLSNRFKRKSSTSSQYVVERPSLTEDWYKRVACCQLKSSRGTGQGLLVDIEALGLQPPAVAALLTNHHIIPSMNYVQDWELQVGPEENKKLFKLNKSSFTHCYSCCGPDGISGKKAPHFQRSASDPPTSCPVGSDFTLLILCSSFMGDLGSKLYETPVLLPPLTTEKEDYQPKEICILRRNFETGNIYASPINLETPITQIGTPSLQGEIDAYKCTLCYSDSWITTKIGRGSSGSGIFCRNERSGEIRLMGIHVSSGVDDAQVHYGLTVQAIVHSIVGGPTCGVIPALSLLMDASKRNHLAARWYQNLQSCLIHEDMNLDRSLKIMNLLLKVEPAIFKFILGDPDVLHSLTLLAALFGSFTQFGSGQIHKEAEEVLTADGSAALNQNVQKHCKQLHELLKEAHEKSNIEVVETCFQCWRAMYYFGGPVYEELYDSAKISSLKGIRENQKYNNCVTVHRAFGDIFVAYGGRRNIEQREYQVELLEKVKELKKLKTRGDDLEQQLQDKKQEVIEVRKRGEEQLQESAQELANVREEKQNLEQKTVQIKLALEQLEAENQSLDEENESQARNFQGLLKHQQEQGEQAQKLQQQQEEQMQKLQHENQQLKKEVKQQQEQMQKLQHENEQLKREVQQHQEQMQKLQHENLLQSSPYKAHRAHRPTLTSDEGDKDFWERDMSKLLEEDPGLREDVCKLFRKVEGGSGEGTWEHLLRYLQERFGVKMDAAKLDTRPIGDIMQSIVQEWGKKEAVTVRIFSDISSKELGVPRVEDIMKEVFLKLKSFLN